MSAQEHENLRREEEVKALVSKLMRKEAASVSRMMTLFSEPLPSHIEFVEARRGEGFGLRVDGKTLDSLYNPVGYAQELLEAQELEDASFVVLVGCGGGALPMALYDLLSAKGDTVLAVYEPDPAVMCGFFARVPGLEGLDSSRVQFFTSAQSLLIHISHLYRRRGKLLLISPPPYKSKYPDELEALTTAVTEGVWIADINVNTSSSRAEEWTRNLLRNIKKRSEHPSAFALEAEFSNVPAVVVSAGPSLDRNIHLLREIQDDVLIICVNTSFKALVKAGVRPHLAMSLESLNVSSHFDGVEEALSEVTLVLDETCHPSLFEFPAKRYFSFLESSPAFLAFTTRALEVEQRGLCVGGSIANAAFSSANLFGCDPIILIGQDLAYTNNQMYASGTVFEDITLSNDGKMGELVDPRGTKQKILDSSGEGKTFHAQRSLLKVKSWDGEGLVPTSSDFNMFRIWFQEASAQLTGTQGTTLINATEGGAWIEGFEHIKLSEAIARHVSGRGGESIDDVIARRHKEAPLLEASVCVKALERASRDCELLLERSTAARRLLDGALESLSREGSGSVKFGQALTKFESVEMTLGSLGNDNSLVEAWIYHQVLEIMKERENDSLVGDQEGQWRANLKQSRDVLSAIIEGSESLMKEFCAAMEE